MAIKSYNKVQYIAPDGTITHGSYPAKIGSVLLETNRAIFRDGKQIPKINRAVCSCGYVDKYDQRPSVCAKCGAKFDKVVYQKNPLVLSNSDFELLLLKDQVFIQEKTIIVPAIEIQLLTLNSTIQISEIKYKILERLDVGTNEIVNNLHFWPAKELQLIEPLLDKIMEGSDLWELVKCRINGIWTEYSSNNNIKKTMYNPIIRKLSLYNTFGCCPWSKAVSDTYLAKILSARNFDPNPFWFSATEDEFLESMNQPKFLRDLCSIYGFAKNNILYMDNLDDSIKDAVRYAIVHHYVEIKYIDEYLGTDVYKQYAVDQMNLFPREYAEFFRRHVIEFGNKTWENFKLLQSSETTSFKQLNVCSMKNYLSTKKYSPEKIKEFEDLIENGDYIAAVKLIASGRN